MIVSLISTEILSYKALHLVLKQFRWYKSWTENNSAGSPKKYNHDYPGKSNERIYRVTVISVTLL